jgi:hypothetical protein
MIVVKFANGKEFTALSVDDAIAQCLKSGHDPYKPTVVEVTINPPVEPIEEVVIKPKTRSRK